MDQNHIVIIIPGLGDNIRSLRLAGGSFRTHGMEVIVQKMGWYNREEFSPKLLRILHLIDRYSNAGSRVSLIGTSAGGSCAINAYCRRKSRVHRIVNVCGRLSIGPVTGLRSFSRKTKHSIAFRESVLLCEKNISSLSQSDRSRIMTLCSFFDDVVPAETTAIPGATNIVLPVPGHILGIATALTLYSGKIIRFISGEDKPVSD
jgi:hypothetical protein